MEPPVVAPYEAALVFEVLFMVVRVQAGIAGFMLHLRRPSLRLAGHLQRNGPLRGS